MSEHTSEREEGPVEGWLLEQRADDGRWYSAGYTTDAVAVESFVWGRQDRRACPIGPPPDAVERMAVRLHDVEYGGRWGWGELDESTRDFWRAKAWRMLAPSVKTEGP